MKCILLICFFLVTGLPSYSQHPFFREIVIEQGNDDLKATTLFQNTEGLIYIGTNQGLYRYDGFDFEKIDLRDSLENSKVTFITNSLKKELLVGLENGVIFKLKNDVAEKLKSPINSPVKSILELENGTLWIASYGEGIFYRTGSDWHRLAGLSDPFVYQLLHHSSGKILAATDGGLVIIDPHTKPVSFRVFDSKNGLPDNIVKVIGVLPDNNILLGFHQMGIAVFDMNSYQFKSIDKAKDWSYGAVNCITKLQNEFWLGTDGNGIVDYEFGGDKRVRNFFDKAGFPFKKVNALLKDMEGNVWVAADHKLIISSGEQVELVDETGDLNFDSLQAIIAGRDGYLWFSTPKGLFRYNYMASGNEKMKRFNFSKNADLHIVSLYEDEAGYIWIGTFDNGLFRFNPENGKVIRFGEKEGLTNANVISMDGKDSVIWIATLGGIVQCRMKDPLQFGSDAGYIFKKLTFDDKRFDGFVYCVFIDRNGKAWFGTDGKGIMMYDGVKLHSFPELNSFKVVYSITEDAYNNIWFSTQFQGLYRYDGKHFRNFNLSNGLSSLEITGISIDNIGNVIVVNKRGIDVINPKNFDVKKIGEESGIGKLDADLNAVTRDSKGGIWIGSRNGLLRFYNYNKAVTDRPKLILKKVYTFMKQMVDLRDTVFDYNQNNISIEYTGIWFTQPDIISYRYRLKGYSNDWIPTRDRIVTFPNLPPGRYTFEVVASLGVQSVSSNVVAYSFRIKKPLWKENWIILSGILLLSLGVFLFIRDRDIKVRRLESLKKEKVEYQFATLKSQVNPHFLFNSFNTLIAIIEEDKDKAISYVEKLSDYFRNMVQHRDKDLISLEEELVMVETYYFLQQKRFGEYLLLEVDIPVSWKKSFGLPPLSLQLLIENAVKHNAVSHETPLRILVKASGSSTLLIENNLNPKMSAEASTGIGLENIINRFNILAGHKVKVTQTAEKFTVEVPLIKLVSSQST
jgi:ligand-binding sensor domain-containing protein